MTSPIDHLAANAPSAWKRTRLKYLAEINRETLTEQTDPDLAIDYIDIASVSSDSGVGYVAQITFGDAPSRARRVVHVRDTIISTVRTYLRAIARVPETLTNPICSTGFAVVTARNDVDPTYLFWLCRATPFVEEIVARSKGVAYPSIDPQEIGTLCVPVAPLNKQRAIADFLDREIRQLTRLIVLNESVAARLEERFDARVSCVTRSAAITNARAAHAAQDAGWKATQLNRCFTAIDYGIGSALSPDGKFPVLGMGNVQAGTVVGSPIGFTNEVDEDLLLQPNELLFSRTNSLAHIGKVARVNVFDQATTFASYLVRFRVAEGIDAGYMNYLLNTSTVLNIARAMALPSIHQANLNPKRYASLHVWIPSIEDQRTARRLLDTEQDRHRRALTLLEQQRALLKERSSGLITAAVTGQLDIAK